MVTTAGRTTPPDVDDRGRERPAGPAHPTVKIVRAARNKASGYDCFRTEKRLSCDDLDCPQREACCRLVAEWRR